MTVHGVRKGDEVLVAGTSSVAEKDEVFVRLDWEDLAPPRKTIEIVVEPRWAPVSRLEVNVPPEDLLLPPTLEEPRRIPDVEYAVRVVRLGVEELRYGQQAFVSDNGEAEFVLPCAVASIAGDIGEITTLTSMDAASGYPRAVPLYKVSLLRRALAATGKNGPVELTALGFTLQALSTNDEPIELYYEVIKARRLQRVLFGTDGIPESWAKPYEPGRRGPLLLGDDPLVMVGDGAIQDSTLVASVESKFEKDKLCTGYRRLGGGPDANYTVQLFREFVDVRVHEIATGRQIAQRRIAAIAGCPGFNPIAENATNTVDYETVPRPDIIDWLATLD